MNNDDNLKDTTKPSGPVKVRNWTIHVDRDLCIGAATCVAIASKTFVLDNEAKAVILKDADNELDNLILDAAKGCPVAAIIIKDEKGEQIFPK